LETTRTDAVTAAKAVVAIIAIIFVAEVVVMHVLRYLSAIDHPTGVIFLDGLLLALLTAPPIYWLVLRPIQREHEKREQAEERAEDMSRLAITDALTRIMNRRGITVSLLDAMAQAERYNTPLAVAMADIDHFKKINDRHGHEAGDRVLVGVAGIMADALRMPDKVGRYGGEEFLLIFPHTTLAQARKIAERIRGNVKQASLLSREDQSVTVSLGLTQFHKGEDLEQLVSRVDRALYDAKEAGRNKVVATKLKV
jgi:diguanylate cyclase (GGDEF)-like protein